jgi:hypothetical protein
LFLSFSEQVFENPHLHIEGINYCSDAISWGSEATWGSRSAVECSASLRLTSRACPFCKAWGIKQIRASAPFCTGTDTEPGRPEPRHAKLTGCVHPYLCRTQSPFCGQAGGCIQTRLCPSVGVLCVSCSKWAENTFIMTEPTDYPVRNEKSGWMCNCSTRILRNLLLRAVHSGRCLNFQT